MCVHTVYIIYTNIMSNCMSMLMGSIRLFLLLRPPVSAVAQILAACLKDFLTS